MVAVKGSAASWTQNPSFCAMALKAQCEAGLTCSARGAEPAMSLVHMPGSAHWEAARLSLCFNIF